MKSMRSLSLGNNPAEVHSLLGKLMVRPPPGSLEEGVGSQIVAPIETAKGDTQGHPLGRGSGVHIGS